MHSYYDDKYRSVQMRSICYNYGKHAFCIVQLTVSICIYMCDLFCCRSVRSEGDGVVSGVDD